MNTQELLNKIKDLCILCVGTKEYIELESVLNLVNQLDQQQKPVVKQFVADWYEENKDDFETNLFQLIESLEIAPCEEDDLIDFIGWLIDKDTKPFQTLVNMHQFGYTVEKEKRYLVKMKGISSNMCYLNRVGNKWIIAGIDEHTGMNIYTKHTKKELEDAGFGWVFDCPGIEIEEVTE